MRPKNAIFKGLILPILVGLFLLVPMVISAKTLYVNSDGDDGNDGSSDHPFKTLEEAAHKVNEGEADAIKIGKGSFSGGVTFEQGVSIEGAGKGSTTITGALTFKKKATLKNLSVKTKARNAITLGKNASGSFRDIDVRDFSAVGITISSGGASLVLENSRVGNSGGKGIYAESGSKINISGSDIVDNKQEGIDIRQNTRGTIKNNNIESNGESGIELIVGSSDFVITGNDIKRNGASGIAYQFYALNKKFGEIKTTGNSFAGNRKFGIDCNKPQAGDTPIGYWSDSIALEGNTFTSNRNGEISTICKLLEAKTEEEERALQEKAAEEAKLKAEEEAKIQAALALAQGGTPEEQERIKQEVQQLNEIVQAAESMIQENEYLTLLGNIAQQNRARVFFWGQAGSESEALRVKIEEDENKLKEYQGQLIAIPSYQSQPDIQSRIATQEERLEQYKKQLHDIENSKGLLHSFQKEFMSRINRLVYVLPF